MIWLSPRWMIGPYTVFGSSPKELPQIRGYLDRNGLFNRGLRLLESRVHSGHAPEDVPRPGEGVQASSCKFASRRATLAATALAFAFAGRRKP